MSESDIFVPKPAAEAKKNHFVISEDAGLSRVLPIQDGPDQWKEHRSSAVTGLGDSAPG
jgi:hypothetical protein